MDTHALTIIGEVVLVPVLTFATIWLKGNLDKDIRREKRDDGYLKNLEDRVKSLENRLDAKEKEIREIRHELKNRDAEYVALYQEYTTLKARYEVLQNDHNDLKRDYDSTVTELTNLQSALRANAENTVVTISPQTL